MNHPRVLLLDEPLGALDLKLRKHMQLELKRIQNEVGITFVHVTHDQEEAMTMADTIAVMNSGRIEQLGPPQELYERPATAFVAGFLGASNLLARDRRGRGCVRLDDGTLVPCGVNGRAGQVAAGVRPEKITLGAGGGANELRRHDLRDRVHRRRDAGRRAHGCGHRARVRAEHRTQAGACPARGSTVTLSWARSRRSSSTGRTRTTRRSDDMNPRLTRDELLRRGAAGRRAARLPVGPGRVRRAADGGGATAAAS